MCLHSCDQPSSVLHPRPASVPPPPPLLKRAKAGKGGLSGFFRRHFLHYAYFQPLASPKTRHLRRLIPMVRNSGAARKGTTLYVGFDVRRIKLTFTRITQHAPRFFDCQRSSNPLPQCVREHGSAHSASSAGQDARTSFLLCQTVLRNTVCYTD